MRFFLENFATVDFSLGFRANATRHIRERKVKLGLVCETLESAMELANRKHAVLWKVIVKRLKHAGGRKDVRSELLVFSIIKSR